MSDINWQNFKVRCSAISKVLSNSRANPTLTDKQREEYNKLKAKEVLTENQKVLLAEYETKEANGSKVILSDTCTGYLMEAYAWETQRMQCVTKEIDIEFLQKGRIVEPQSINLLAIVDDCYYEKNEERIYNDYLSGIPDIYKGTNIIGCERLKDIKSVWDYPGFLSKVISSLDNANKAQLQGYGDICGCQDLEVAYCLVSMPEQIVNDYKRRLFYKLNVVTEESPEYIAAWEELSRSMYFDCIPIHKRVHKIKVEPFTKEEQTRLYDRVKVCRDWLSQFHENYEELNLR